MKEIYIVSGDKAIRLRDIESSCFVDPGRWHIEGMEAFVEVTLKSGEKVYLTDEVRAEQKEAEGNA